MELLWEDYADVMDTLTSEDPLEFHKAQLATAIGANDVKKLKGLLNSRGGIDFVDVKKYTLLHYAVQCDNIEVLDVLLGTDGAPIDAEDEDEDGSNQTVLLLAIKESSEAMILKILEKDVDVNLVDDVGNSPLHQAVFRNLPTVSKIVIKKGANINCRNNFGATPLLTACSYGSVEHVCMLLYYGADVTIPTITGDPPFFAANHEIQEILFDYIFDGDKIPVLLNIVTAALASDSPLLEKLFANISKVYYCHEKDLNHMAQQLFLMNPRYFKIFVQNFEEAAEKLLSHCSILLELLTAASPRAVENMKTLLNSNLASAVIDNVNMAGSFSSSIDEEYITLGDFVSDFSEFDEHLHEAFLEITSEFLRKGAKCDPPSLCQIYEIYGFNQLFKQMATMDVAEVNSKELSEIMPRLILDVKSTLEDLLNTTSRSSLGLELEHFCHQQLKDVYSEVDDEAIRDKLEKLPRVPLLVELARNVARKHIITWYNVETFGELSELVDRLPITKEAGRILTYEKKLYG